MFETLELAIYWSPTVDTQIAENAQISVRILKFSRTLNPRTSPINHNHHFEREIYVPLNIHIINQKK